MIRDLSRLLRPRHIAVIGGGAWCRAVIAQSRKIGFAGEIWPVHPHADEIDGLPVWRSVADLPQAPDAAFLGVNRTATITLARDLSDRGAGGIVCFASGFAEAQAEDDTACDLQAQLLAACGDMPMLGPNCYGFVNYLDGALLWPDQHGGTRVDSGVAIVTQSSNIALNLTMQQRGLPLAYVVTAGNQAQSGLADIGATLLEDPRVTALGLHIEGIGAPRALEALADRARRLGKRIVAIKVGVSPQARQAAVSHTASLAGEDAAASALLARLGIARVNDLPTFLETLKVLHMGGPVHPPALGSISCSGGEASLAADTGARLGLTFPALTETQNSALRAALGPRVALANPLDYHTYVWRDVPAMTAAFAAMADPGIGIVLLVVDFPRPDRCDASDWECVIAATAAAAAQTDARYGLVATLPELLPEDIADRLIGAGVVPFCGLTEALAACAAAALPAAAQAPPTLQAAPCPSPAMVPEAEAKTALAGHGLRVPKALTADAPDAAARAAGQLGGRVVLKGTGVAHKTEHGAVVLNLTTPEAVARAARAMPSCAGFLVEEMISDTCAELLVGVLHDPAHGFMLTLGAGGVETELRQDTQTLLIPATEMDISAALDTLRMAPLLHGYRGRPAADRAAILRAVMAIQDYACQTAEGLHEIEVNPLICTPTDAIAADILLRRTTERTLA